MTDTPAIQPVADETGVPWCDIDCPWCKGICCNGAIEVLDGRTMCAPAIREMAEKIKRLAFACEKAYWLCVDSRVGIITKKYLQKVEDITEQALAEKEKTDETRA